jgi:hypothetical protein
MLYHALGFGIPGFIGFLEFFEFVELLGFVVVREG